MIDFKVSVRCMTYNQASYIVDALNGFCMQQTSFPYVCCILDDASTDGEQDVIRKYLEDYFDLNDNSVVKNEDTDDYSLTFAQHKNNRNCYFAVYYLKYNHYKIWDRKYQYISQWEHVTKYIAMCEGDDYWIDSNKLQEQYLFMASNPNCSLCFHPTFDLYSDGKMKQRCPAHIKQFYGTEDAIIGGSTMAPTNSLFFHKKVILEERPSFWANAPIGDFPLILFFSTKGELGFINSTMSVYRKEAIGSWSSRNRSIRTWNRMVNGLLKMYDEFDMYTDYRYHSIIEKEKKKNNTIIRVRGILGAIKTNFFKKFI